MKRALLTFAFCLLTSLAFAWPACNGNWAQVPTGTTGGTIYVTGDHLTFQCKMQNHTCQGGHNCNGGATTNNTSNSTSNATSSSVSTATASQNQEQTQSQAQTANGGNASSTSAATNNGNGSNNTVTNVEAAKIPVATAYAPASYPTVTCFKGIGAGIQTGAFGGSFGGGKIDENCAILETAAHARNLLTYCKVYITNKYAKQAGVTLEQCMSDPEPTIAPPVPASTVIVVPLPAPKEYQTQIEVTPSVGSLASCNRLDNVCKQKLDEAVLFYKTKDGQITVTGNVASAKVADGVRDYLRKNGVRSVLTQLSDESTDGSVQVSLVQ